MRWLFLAIFMSSMALADVKRMPEVALEWDASPDADIKGYKLYWGAATGTYADSMDLPLDGVNDTSVLVTNLKPGATYYFVVTAYNEHLESEPSNEISWTAPNKPGAPTKLRLKIAKNAQGKDVIVLSMSAAPGQLVSIEATEDLKDWEVIGHALASETGDVQFEDEDFTQYKKRFYRAM